MIDRLDSSVAPSGRRRAIAVVSVHASPVGRLGEGENGGMNRAILRLCEELSARGVPSDVFVRRDDPHAPAERLLAPGSRLVLLPAGPAAPLPKSQVLLHLPQFTRALLDHAADERRAYRIVHSHYWLSGWVARRAARRWEAPWVHSSHTLARLKSAAGLPADDERAAIEEILVRSADRLVAVSDAEARALVDLYGADPESVCIVPPGVDHEHFRPRGRAALRARLGLSEGRAVLYAGRLEPLKGADLLLEAMGRLRAAGGFEDVVLLLAGENSGDGRRQAGHPDGERGRLEALAARLGLGAVTRFLGVVAPAELADLMVAADAVAVPSMTETFGLVALEAQAAGTPVVATAVGGLADLVADRTSGRLVEGRDPGRFAAALADVLGDDDRRRRMGEAGRDRAEGFTWQRSAERLLSLYDCVESPELAAVPEACGCL